MRKLVGAIISIISIATASQAYPWATLAQYDNSKHIPSVNISYSDRNFPYKNIPFPSSQTSICIDYTALHTHGNSSECMQRNANWSGFGKDSLQKSLTLMLKDISPELIKITDFRFIPPVSHQQCMTTELIAATVKAIHIILSVDTAHHCTIAVKGE